MEGLSNSEPTTCEDCGKECDNLDQGKCPECMRLFILDIPF